MNAGAINRLLQILDEDCSGDITWKELTFALDLYKCQTEKPSTPDKLSPKTEAVFKLLALMKERRMKPEELFRMIDLDKSNVLDLAELEEVICSLGDYSKKEVKSIHDFFDINNDGKVDYNEFITQCAAGIK